MVIPCSSCCHISTVKISTRHYLSSPCSNGTMVHTVHFLPIGPVYHWLNGHLLQPVVIRTHHQLANASSLIVMSMVGSSIHSECRAEYCWFYCIIAKVCCTSPGCDINGCSVACFKLNIHWASKFFQLLPQWASSFSGLDT